MKRCLVISALLLLLAACGQEKTPTISHVETPQPDPDDNLRAAVSEMMKDEDVQSISIQESKIEVSLLYCDEIPPDQPETWVEDQDTAMETCAQLQELAGEHGKTFAVVYLTDSNENVILSVMNGKVSYDAFGEMPDISAPNDPTISLGEFSAIETGMSYQQVCDIIGGPGELLSESDLGLGDQFVTSMYSWDGEGSLGASASIMFQGGKVISKSQSGLQ